MRSGIKDVAEEAGVSIATVSRVLNNKDRVSPMTRLKVREAVEKLGYQPDLVARSMVKKQTMTVGLLVPSLANEFWAEMAESIHLALRRQGYSLMVSSTAEADDSQVSTLIKGLVDRKMDGIILGSIALNQAGWQLVNESGIPVIGFEIRNPLIYSVCGDHQQGASQAVRHLIGLGHREIAFIGGSEQPDEREIGYRTALAQAGIPVLEQRIIRIRYGFDSGYQAVRRLIDQEVAFSAVFCWNDVLAIGVINGLRDSGLMVPDDIAVVGFDDIYMAQQYKPQLTTVRQPIEDMSQAVVAMLVGRKQQEGQQRSPRIRKFPMRLVVRESCGCRDYS